MSVGNLCNGNNVIGKCVGALVDSEEETLDDAVDEAVEEGEQEEGGSHFVKSDSKILRTLRIRRHVVGISDMERTIVLTQIHTPLLSPSMSTTFIVVFQRKGRVLQDL